MTPEQENMSREIVRAVLLHAQPDGFGWRSSSTFTFTDDEKKAMEEIINDRKSPM